MISIKSANSHVGQCQWIDGLCISGFFALLIHCGDVEIMLSEFKDRVEQYMESEGLTNEYVAAEEMVEGYVMTGTVNHLMDEYKSKQRKQRDESSHGKKRPK